MDSNHLWEIGLIAKPLQRTTSKVQYGIRRDASREKKIVASLSPAYAALLNTPVWEDIGKKTLDEHMSPCWALLVKSASMEQDAEVGGMNLPTEWLCVDGASSPVPLASMLAALKGLGRNAHVLLETGAKYDFIEKHKSGFLRLPNGIEMMSSLIEEGTSRDMPRVHAALGILCILVEHCFHCLWDQLESRGEPRPALLRDLVLDSRINELLPQGLGLCTKVLFLPAGLNLRNLLLHGFLTSEVLPYEFFGTVLLTLTCIVDCAVAPSEALPPEVLSCSNAQTSQLPSLFDDISHQWLALLGSVDEWLFSSTSFLGCGYDALAVRAFAELRNGRVLLGIAMLLPVLEHSLRLEFCSSNHAPGYGIAQHGSYYSTLDGFGQRSKHQLLLGSSVESSNQPNLLLLQLGDGLVHLLSDLFLQDAGPNIRACIVHGKIHNFGNIYNAWPSTTPINAVVVIFLLLCARQLPRNSGYGMDNARNLLSSAESLVNSYRPIFHPNAILAKSFARSAVAVERFALSLASRLPVFVEVPDSGSKRLAQPGHKDHIKFECEAAVFSETKGSILSLVGLIRKEFENYGLFSSNDAAIASLIALLPKVLVSSPSNGMQPPSAKATRNVSDWLSDSQWHNRLLMPDLSSLSQCVPFQSLILGLLDALQSLADSLTNRIESLESLIVDRKAKTRQRRQHIATLLSGPAFVEYLMAVLLALEHHIEKALKIGTGIPEDPLARVANVTSSLTGMGDDDDNRRGYDSGLVELSGFLRTKAARLALSKTS